VKLHSCTAYTEVGVDLGGLLRCWPSYASPTIVSSGTNMFYFGPSLELAHFHSRRSSKLHSY
jgi:hypothetical protein